MPRWFNDLSPTLQDQVRQQAFKADITAMPSPEEVGQVVLDYWTNPEQFKKH